MNSSIAHNQPGNIMNTEPVKSIFGSLDIVSGLPYISGGVALHPKSCTLIYTGRGLNAIQSINYTNSILLHGITRLGFEILDYLPLP